MITMPNIMIAPNGARRTKADHPRLPMTIAEIVECARDCAVAGADGIHAHVRDEQGQHVLDVGLYRELQAELSIQVPEMTVQVTSEAAGIYQPEQQRRIIRELKPAYVSVAMREMLADDNDTREQQRARDFYHWAYDEQVTIQHIIYSADDIAVWFQRVADGIMPMPDSPAGVAQAQLLFVLGRYRKNQQSSPEDLQPFLDALRPYQADYAIDWAVCAFGSGETDCLLAAAEQGGRLRIGFENSLWHSDGTVAADNCERVEYLCRKLSGSGTRI
ncbi:MAG: 3-keto-5-aminohexanoate cleavage protein [Thiolinea sp.]